MLRGETERGAGRGAERERAERGGGEKVEGGARGHSIETHRQGGQRDSEGRGDTETEGEA